MTKKALIIGASRGIGLGLVRELAARDWEVTGTVRHSSGTALHALATGNSHVSVEKVDILENDAVIKLKARLKKQKFDLILVNAGIAMEDLPISETSAGEFSRVLLTNAYAPAKFIELYADLLTENGSLAVTSSRQGSISLNTRGDNPVYRASKSALNQLIKSFAATHPSHSVLALHPGWVQTDLGNVAGQAPLTIEESTSGLANVIEKHLGEKGIQFLDYQDQIVEW